MKFDRIIVSSDESYFLQYWIIVAKAWNKFYPEKKLTLAFVTNKTYDNLTVKKLQEYGEVVLFPVIDGIPTANQAKMARHILATKYENDISMIEDIDSIPLQRGFVDRVTSFKEEGKLLSVGYEVYENSEHKGKFPISNITGEGNIFKEILNPNNLQYEDLIKSWIGLKVFDHKEAINNPSSVFSDESLFRALIIQWNGNVTKTRRDVNIHTDWIDRSWWSIDSDKLNNGGYVMTNFLRPFDENYSRIEPIVKYIFGEDMEKENVVFKY